MSLCGEYDDDLVRMNANVVKRKVVYQRPSPDDQWRINVANEMTNFLHGNNFIDGLTYDDAQTILDYICIS